ncbi:phosphotransferase [Alkalimarinus alittae]|uniref:Phosphotransferase n=1 Tax=Alkalimarinus alittae TaxID=2961619 RepID=A0ABY6N2G2_9ALTE|nr:phosphotransferase [Alkalimarinus alittae]UZE96271.1 phosphotransferase [Alkalimarinus alittae]
MTPSPKSDSTESDRLMFESVNQFLGTPLPWRAIASKGSTNRLLSAQWGEEKLILRINAAADLAFGVSRESEAQILALVQGYRWAPKVIKNHWQEGWCVMQHHGETISRTACQAISPLLIESVTQWQRIPPVDSARFDYTALFNAYRSRLLNDLVDSAQTSYLLLLDELINRFGELPEVPLCLTHHDLHPGNICGHEKQLTVLDWEYAGFGNPWFDAACLHAKLGAPIAMVSALPAFQHLSHKTLKQGMTNAIKLTNVLESLWFSVRSSVTSNTYNE